MKATIEALLGSYTVETVTETIDETTYIVGIVPDWEWLVGAALVTIAFYSMFRIIGSLILRVK